MSVETNMDVRLARPTTSAYCISTDRPESDGTIAWNQTTLVCVHVYGGNKTGLGYTYADIATAKLIDQTLAPIIEGNDASAIPSIWRSMKAAVRNLGCSGIASMAISAVDTALWDLKSRLLDIPLVSLWGMARDRVPVYGSGGFTSYTVNQLKSQLEGWVQAGIPRVKMKVGRDPGEDVKRVRAARQAIGEDAQLFVDANGAYERKQALEFAEQFVEAGVTWFEEPVPSDDLIGLQLMRDRSPAAIEIAAGEYGYDLPYFRRMLEAGAVDVLQADASRCNGFSGFLQVAAICSANLLPMSAHCAPSLHRHLCCSALPIRHIEYFHDHSRIEQLLFDGFCEPENGCLAPDLSRLGNGLELKEADAQPFIAWSSESA